MSDDRIARMNARITFQKNTVTYDAFRNQWQAWADYFTCAAYASTFQKDEDVAVTVSEAAGITFVVRYCPELAQVTSTGYRVLFRDEVYNILSVDHMNYQKNELRFRCEREKRNGQDEAG